MSNLSANGWSLVRTKVEGETLSRLRASAFAFGLAGQRCLLDQPIVGQVAVSLKTELNAQQILSSRTVAIQAIAFDKSPQANWKVTWHQDLMFPFKRTVRTSGFDLPSIKDGIDYARPPRQVLEQLLAVRLHLDDCTPENGPLRVITGSHMSGVIAGAKVSETVKRGPEVTCLANEGDALLMRPLLLHASSPAQSPRHRRVLHFVYYDGPDTEEPWHRAV